MTATFQMVGKTLPCAEDHTNMVSASSLRKMLLGVLVMMLLSPPPVQGLGTCRDTFRCFNGGIERYGQSIFGPCRCKCRAAFTGPRCQYLLASHRWRPHYRFRVRRERV